MSGASDIDTATDNLYAFFASQDGGGIVTYNLATRRNSSVLFTLKPIVHWEMENVFQVLWISSRQQLAVLWAGIGDAGFDQIAQVDPVTGAAIWLNSNLANDNLFFMCDMATKSCDLLQTACFDATTNRIYFQATRVDGQDDIGTTVLMYLDLAARQPYVDTGLDPFTFGYMGFKSVPVLA